MIAELLAYLSLFAWSFGAATVLPLSSEAALAALVGMEQQLVMPVLVATAGNYGGACTTYWLGSRARRLLDGTAATTRRQRYAITIMKRWGQAALLLSWLPILGDALVAVAGATGMPFARFSVWVILGKAGRYLAVAWAALAVLGYSS